MIVAGGVYQETCITPSERAIFGSGGRAAAFLVSGGVQVTLHTFCPEGLQRRTRAALSGAGVELTFHEAQDQPHFRYLHPLSRPVVSPWPINRGADFAVEGDLVLRFGMMEGEAVVAARRAIFDPQSPTPASFRANGSQAEALAIVSNMTEIAGFMPAASMEEGAKAIAQHEGAQVVIVKAGAMGAYVFSGGILRGRVPPYRSEAVYKIGSGDIFSAAFADAWGRRDEPLLQAADFASKAVAHYCETRTLKLDSVRLDREALPFRDDGLVYLAAPFFTVGDLWVVEEAARCLQDVGANVFSPFHQVGFGDPQVVASADLEGLRSILSRLSHRLGCRPRYNFRDRSCCCAVTSP